jgi:DNA modification methylase
MCNHDWIACGDEKMCLLCGQVVKADEPAPSVTEMIFRQKNRPINQVLHGNSLEVLKTLEDNSVDSIVTDPPYELGFMGKKWDSTGIAYNVELWKECLRVLKPGGHLLAFGGTRTYHRMTCAIEDAGFEIRDCIQWLYGSGFPKSHDISKAIDKKLGAEREVVGTKKGKGGENLNILSREGKNDSKDAKGCGAFGQGAKQVDIDIPVTIPASEEAKQWDGWGTALKPANEPIVLARKPLSEKTVAENVLKWGTGGINIDDCRIELNGDYKCKANGRPSLTGLCDNYDPSKANQPDTQGRFPANVILDEEAGRMLDEQSGSISYGNKSGGYSYSDRQYAVQGFVKDCKPKAPSNYGDSGGASRFFYCAKASKKERNMGLEDVEPTTVDDGRNKPIDNPFLRGKTPRQNTHPTVKPVKLMEYLITLITPPNGIVLDPFFGSGTTGIAAVNLGFNYIGIELDEQYIEIARRRINAVGE